MAIEATDNTFKKEVLESKGTVLVDFWAEWCGPCKQLLPHVEQLSKDMEGKVKVVKVNIDKSPDTPQSFGVRGIPTLILFKDGKQVATKVGSLPKSSLYEWVESNIA